MQGHRHRTVSGLAVIVAIFMIGTEACRHESVSQLWGNFSSLRVDPNRQCEPQCGRATVGKIIDEDICESPGVTRTVNIGFTLCMIRCEFRLLRNFENCRLVKIAKLFSGLPDPKRKPVCPANAAIVGIFELVEAWCKRWSTNLIFDRILNKRACLTKKVVRELRKYLVKSMSQCNSICYAPRQLSNSIGTGDCNCSAPLVCLSNPKCYCPNLQCNRGEGRKRKWKLILRTKILRSL